MKLNIQSPVSKKGLFQAAGVAAYCGSIGLLFWKGNELFGRLPSYLGPVMFLLLFSSSVMICGLLVFYQPYKMFFDGKKEEAADLVLATAVWLFVFFLMAFVLAVAL